MTKEQALIKDYGNALLRLKEALALPKTPISRDASIQRFEFTFDLAWKLIKTVLEEKHGTLCVSPKTCLREAFQKGLIALDDAWIELADDRNLTVHTYNEELADAIYAKLPKAFELCNALRDKLTETEH